MISRQGSRSLRMVKREFWDDSQERVGHLQGRVPAEDTRRTVTVLNLLPELVVVGELQRCWQRGERGSWAGLRPP